MVMRSSSLARSCLVKRQVKMIKCLIVNSVGDLSVRYELMYGLLSDRENYAILMLR